MLSRRALLTTLAAAAGTSACGSSSEVDPTPTTPTPVPGTPDPSGDAPKVLVVVFQRFATDWINLLVPYGDPDYAALRPTLKIDAPIVLDDFYGLHPALAALKPLYDAGELGFVTATGWIPQAQRDRSHFYAQVLAEAASSNDLADGWLSRAMNRDPYRDGVFAALAVERTIPNSLQGFAPAIAANDLGNFTHGSVMGNDVTVLLEQLATMAGSSGEPTRRLATAMRQLAENPLPQPTATYPATTMGNGLRVAAQSIRGGLAPRVITVTSDDDWDTHTAQASRHNATLPNFAGALSAFRADLGEQFSRVTLVTMTEFGRKARENLGGTDHGTASSMLVMGGGIAGGRVYGQWPGLASDKLFDGQDLEPTTDFRSVLAEILGRRFGYPAATLDEIFPGGYAASTHWRRFCA